MNVVDFLGGVIIVNVCAFDNQVVRGCVGIKQSLTYPASEARLSLIRQGERSEVSVRGQR